jgi:cytidylate kinase
MEKRRGPGTPKPRRSAMKVSHRSIDQIVEEQAKKWQVRSKEKGREKESSAAERVITISGEPGGAAHVVGRRVAEMLHYDYFERNLIHQVAESAHMSESMVESLDEKGHKLLEDWISAFFTDRHLWSDQYMQHLVKVLLTIAQHGRAVVIGRGAAFVIPPENALRVRIVAPLEMRMRNYSHEFGMSLDEAAARIKKTETDRAKFVKQNFHSDVADVKNYDLVLDSWRLGIKGAAEAIVAAQKNFGCF